MSQESWQQTLKEIASQAKNDPQAAETALRAFLIQEQGNDLCAALTHDTLGRVLFALHRPTEAITSLETSVALMERAKGKESPMTCLAMQNLAHIYMMQGRIEESITLGETALNGLLAACGDGHELTAGAMLHLSAAYYTKRDFDRAEDLLRKAQTIWESHGEPYPAEVGTCLNNLGRIYEERGAFEEGIALHQRAVLFRKERLGEHPDTAFSLGNLGVALASHGQWSAAVKALEESLALYGRLGIDDEGVEGYRKNLAVCRTALAQQQENSCSSCQGHCQ